MHFNLSDNCIDIYFSNPRGSSLKLKYQLYDHVLSDRWIDLMKNGMEDRHVENNGHFYGKRFCEIEKIEQEINNSITLINDYSEKFKFPQIYIPLIAKMPMSVEFLNNLHEYFEKIDQFKKLKFIPDLKEAICNLNIAIHKAEQFTDLGAFSSDHVQVLLVPQVNKELRLEDYQLFQKDIRFGELYLSYGLTGVPTKEAFTHNTEMKPQNIYSSGMQLSFMKDLVFEFQEQLDIWLEEKNHNPRDPKLAIGAIPLGKIIEPEIEDHDQFLAMLTQYQHVYKVEFSKKSQPAKWPYDNEIFYHLDYCPYLDLEINFDSKKMLKEAQNLLTHFVVHRDFDQTSNNENGKWKSLGLRSLFGDYTKTQYHTSYEFSGGAVYINTIFMDQCPTIKSFLESLTDIEKCERVRLMLLEPGAKIKVHRDSNDRDVSLAVNISLNMPEGCEFWAGLNPDGSKNAYSKMLPFKDSGSVFLFNNAKYHYLENNSSLARIHIVFHGPIRISDEELIEKARKQNEFTIKKDLIQSLLTKKSMIGECLLKTKTLLPEWINSGLLPTSLPENIEVCIWDHEKYGDEARAEKALSHITVPSFFPLSNKIIQESEIDQAIVNALANFKTHIVFIAAGTMIMNVYGHLFNLVRFCQKMIENKDIVAGHILDHVVEGRIPYFHEQYLIINLEEWRKVVTLKMGPLFTKEIFSFSSYERSSNNFHDNYTPHWISEGNLQKIRTGHAKWGTFVMNEIIEKGKKVVGLPEELRNSKTYSYPRELNSKTWDEVQSIIIKQIDKSKNDVFVFNNESLRVAYLDKIKPNTIISMAAGLKPFKILDLYKLEKNSKIHFVDFSEKSLKYIELIVKSKNVLDIVHAASIFGNEKNIELINHHVQSLVRDYFDNSEECLLQSIYIAENASFSCVNLINDTNFISNLLNAESRFIIWISNVFYNNQLYYFLTKEEAHKAFICTATNIAQKMKTHAYLLQNTNTIIFGNSIESPIGLMTDGAAQELSCDNELWSRL